MDEIIIVDYDPGWPEKYEQEAARLRAALDPSLIIRIEHIGSTSIPNLPAKPIIDLLVGVTSLDRARQEAIPALEALGYAFWFDNPDKDHLFFVKGLPPNSPRSHHVHIVEMNNDHWDSVVFRDYLRAHPAEAARYAALKRDLAVRYRADREAYTEAKGDFVREIMEKARAETKE